MAASISEIKQKKTILHQGKKTRREVGMPNYPITQLSLDFLKFRFVLNEKASLFS